jgi:hypothetical protein
MNEIKIEKGIPIPARGTKGKWTSPLFEMKTGDSFVADNLSVAGCVRSSAIKSGYKIKTRGIGNGKIRIWKV